MSGTEKFTNQIFKVLVIDDDAVDRMAVIRAFRDADFRVQLIQAIDCASAISLVNAEHFDCIFIDYRLPDGNGIELLQMFRQQGIRVPIVSLTGQSDDRVAAELMKAGASDYLSKSEMSSTKLRQVFQNVMRVYHAEITARVANRQREELLKQKEEFIFRMTHDLQTPLVAANRMLESIGEDAFGEIPERVKQHLKTIIRSNEDLLQMVHNIVEAYTYDTDSKKFNFISLNLLPIVEEVITELMPIAAIKNLQLRMIILDRELADANFIINGDRLELKRLITNLVGNSLKFTEVGHIEIELTPSTRERNFVTVAIVDTGVGIPPHDMANLFARFRRGHHKRSNSGLGLYLCKQITEAHQGQISVSSTLGAGSRFAITLPVSQLQFG
jgi:signal transduction histidine kinase